MPESQTKHIQSIGAGAIEQKFLAAGTGGEQGQVAPRCPAPVDHRNKTGRVPECRACQTNSNWRPEGVAALLRKNLRFRGLPCGRHVPVTGTGADLNFATACGPARKAGPRTAWHVGSSRRDSVCWLPHVPRQRGDWDANSEMGRGVEFDDGAGRVGGAEGGEVWEVAGCAHGEVAGQSDDFV